ncbi:hypothetical protein KFK09_005024 [Dendrobium nobile]|uniref:Uncharacterized protein n=1 Tax=Dendrobium nobile TaxID=94219 RepID=A0A8T3BZM8_DENNO|nr:hypothetical protein KFK09_005024 [Dendrobium nobile]
MRREENVGTKFRERKPHGDDRRFFRQVKIRGPFYNFHKAPKHKVRFVSKNSTIIEVISKLDQNIIRIQNSNRELARKFEVEKKISNRIKHRPAKRKLPNQCIFKG